MYSISIMKSATLASLRDAPFLAKKPGVSPAKSGFNPRYRFLNPSGSLISASFAAFVSIALIRQRRAQEALEQRMRLVRLGLELGMELAGEEPGVIAQLDQFDELAVG